MRRLLSTTTIVAGALWFATPADATPSIPASTCSTNDVTLAIATTTYKPTQCAADIEIGQGSANAATETGILNTAFGTNFTFLARAEPSGNTGATLHGIQFGLTTGSFNATTGSFIMSWQDTNGAAADNLPITIDFAVLLNGGSNGDGYLFQGVTLPIAPTTGTGSFVITFFNNGGNNPGLSHMQIIGGNDVQINPTCTVNCDPDPVPEPASLALFGVGLLGLGFISAKRRYS